MASLRKCGVIGVGFVGATCAFTLATSGLFSLGYNRPLSPHWNLEFEAGLGVLWTHNDKYVCKTCGQKVATLEGVRLVPTKLAVNIVYLF